MIKEQIKILSDSKISINLNFKHDRSTSRIANALAYICGLLIGICPDCKCISSLNNRDLAKEYRLPGFARLHAALDDKNTGACGSYLNSMQ